MTIRFLLPIVALCFSSFPATAQTAKPLQDKTALDPMRLLPESSRHVFRPAPRQWAKKVEFLRLQPGGGAFIVLQPSDKPNPKTDWRDVRYFHSATEDDNKLRKIERFRPDGSLAEKIDRTGDEQFDLRFDRQGQAVFYDHLIGRKRIAGWSVSPDGKTVTHFSRGDGNWIEWDETGSGFTRNWVDGGDFFLIQKTRAGRLLQTTLLLESGAQLQITPTGEELNLWSQHERWGKKTGAPVWAQIDDYRINGKDASIVKDDFPDDEVKRHIRAAQPQMFLRSGPPRKRDPLLQQQLEADYLQRRAAFISNYEVTLRSAGQSWKSLGLESAMSPPKS